MYSICPSVFLSINFLCVGILKNALGLYARQGLWLQLFLNPWMKFIQIMFIPHCQFHRSYGTCFEHFVISTSQEVLLRSILTWFFQ